MMAEYIEDLSGIRSGQPVRLFGQETEAGKQTVLTPYFPAEPSGPGCVIIFPGGGYEHVSLEKEGTKIAAALNAKGLRTFVLDYHVAPAPRETILRDAVRAVRFVRLHAADLGVDPEKIAVMGFSAGGHLAQMTALYAGEVRTGSDAVSAVSGKPDALILSYPVVTFTDPYAHTGSRRRFLGPDRENDAEMRLKYSGEKQAGPGFPPVFLWHCEGDTSVPVQNSLMLGEALERAGVVHELTVYPGGAHGLGLAPGYEEISGWFDKAVRWLGERFVGQR